MTDLLGLVGVMLLIGALVWVAIQIRQLHADLLPVIALADSPLAHNLSRAGT